MSARGPSTAIGAAAALAMLSIAAPTWSSSPSFGTYDVVSLFTISKSENKNQVVYAIHIDARCAPVGDAPVLAYWRMNEKGPNVIAPLLAIEEKAYGIERQRVVASGGSRGGVEITLRAMPSRPVVVRTAPDAGRCEAWSTLPIAGETAFLYDVYVKLSGPLVEYLLLSGWSADRSRTVRERLAR